MKLRKLILVILTSAIVMPTQCQTLLKTDTTIVIKTKLFDYFVKQNIKEKQYETDDSLATAVIGATMQQKIDCDSVCSYQRNIINITNKETELQGQSLDFTTKQLNHEIKSGKRIRLFSLLGAGLETFFFGWYVAKNH